MKSDAESDLPSGGLSHGLTSQPALAPWLAVHPKAGTHQHDARPRPRQRSTSAKKSSGRIGSTLNRGALDAVVPATEVKRAPLHAPRKMDRNVRRA